MRVAADVAVFVVAEEERAGDERDEPADLVVDQRHRVGDAEARAERLRDLVERLFLAVRAGDVLQRDEALPLDPLAVLRIGSGRRR